MPKFFEEEKQSFHYPIISEMRKSSNNYMALVIGIVLLIVVGVIISTIFLH